jgi:CheY-like chemotaxis protein
MLRCAFPNPLATITKVPVQLHFSQKNRAHSLLHFVRSYWYEVFCFMATVLIADDSRVQVQQMSYWLQDIGCKVVSAMDAYQAVRKASSTTPDAIILDLNMPEGSGITVLRELKSSMKTARIPVLVVSGSEASMEPLVRSMGAIGYLKKPVSFEEFSAALGQMLPVT